MSKPVQLFCWHFMSYPYLPADFDEKYDTGWITVPNTLWDREKSRGLLNEYIDQLAYADTLGFDGMVLNEHHQNVYGLMPSPNIIASALSAENQQRQDRRSRQSPAAARQSAAGRGGIRHGRQSVERARHRRLCAGWRARTFNYNTPAAIQREQFWEAVELIHQAWTRPGPFTFEGKHYPLRYVNPWPQPIQQPHPQVWIPGSQSRETMRQIAQRGYCYFLSSRVHGGAIARARQEFAKILEDAGSKYDPFRMGILMSAYVSETDEQAREESHEGVWYFLKNCLKGHLRNLNGRSLTSGPGIPNMEVSDYARLLENTKPGRAMLGDADDWDALQKAQSIIVGSPDTVYRQIIDLVRETQVGNLLIQFHMGNMRDDLARKSMRLFATQVAPRLREDSRVAFASSFAELADAP